MRFPTLLLTGVLALSATASYGLLQHPRKADTNPNLAQALEIRVGDWVSIPKCPNCAKTDKKYCVVANTASQWLVGQECSISELMERRRECEQQYGMEEKSDQTTNLYPNIKNSTGPCDVKLALICYYKGGMPQPVWREVRVGAPCGRKPTCDSDEPLDTDQFDNNCDGGHWEE